MEVANELQLTPGTHSLGTTSLSKHKIQWAGENNSIPGIIQKYFYSVALSKISKIRNLIMLDIGKE